MERPSADDGSTDQRINCDQLLASRSAGQMCTRFVYRLCRLRIVDRLVSGLDLNLLH
jgi:hypothetical protein